MRKFNFFALLLVATLISSSVFSQNKEWTVVATYEIPGKASGLAWDGAYLYSGLYSAPGDDNLIYRINPNDGTYSLFCTAPQEKSYGLTFDGEYLWSTDRTGSFTPAIAVQFDDNGTLLSQFDLPDTYISGIAYDNGNFRFGIFFSIFSRFFD